MVIPSLSVGENIFLNRSDRSLIRWQELRRQARQLLLEWGFDLDVDQPADELSVEQKQVVEIARALGIGARFLILDEPTASLESHAIERLFDRVRRVKASGVAILYISHHLEEVYEICDRATVLRDGKRIVTAPVTELDRDKLVTAMVGSELARSIREDIGQRGDGEGKPRLRVRSLSVQTPLGSVEDVSFDVHVGECVGLNMEAIAQHALDRKSAGVDRRLDVLDDCPESAAVNRRQRPRLGRGRRLGAGCAGGWIARGVAVATQVGGQRDTRAMVPPRMRDGRRRRRSWRRLDAMPLPAECQT